MTSDINMIALSKLVEGKNNVRRTQRAQSVGELAASIEAHGLLQSLVVAPCGNGRYSVEAGGRRLKALRLLAKRGAIAKNAPIPCRVVPVEAAAEASLAENIVRAAMHPADEIEAFAQLAGAGEGPEAIAARFGVSGAHVARRLKLARVSPRLIEAFRKGALDLDQLSALAFCDDHAQQEAAFFAAPAWARSPERLKAQLTQAHVCETDKLARFVGLEAYEAEGGVLVADLFAEEGAPRWLADRDLLARLAQAKLGALLDEVRAEGWAWAEIELDGVPWSRFPERVRERRRALTADEEAERERLYAKLDEAEDEAEIERLEAAIDAIAAAGWQADEVALAGAIVTLTHDGAAKVERGLVRSEDAKALRALQRKLARIEDEEEDDGGAAGGNGAAASRTKLPQKLMDELMAHKTLALRAELAEKPDLALRLLVLALASNALHDFSVFSLVRVRIEETDVARSITRAESPAPAALAAIEQSLRERLPSGVDALWAFLSQASQDRLLELLAALIAPGVELKAGRAGGVEEAICDAAGLDMSRYWRASPESYFAHVRKDVIVEAMRELNPALDRGKLEKASKSELLARAEIMFEQSAWLPEPLRSTAAPSRAVAAE